MAYPPVVVVNSDDKVVGWSPLSEAWEKELVHRIVYVIVEDSQGRILLHQRAQSMQLYPGRWDTVGGHVDVTPDYEESARIELREEGGVEDEPLEEIAYFYSDLPYSNGTRAKRFIKIFRVRYDGDVGHLDDEEVAATRWYTKEELAQFKKDSPEQIAIGLEICLPYILHKEVKPKAGSSSLAAASP